MQMNDFLITKAGSYLLGAIHGDGHVSQRSVSIAIDGKVSEYADSVQHSFYQLGIETKRYITNRGLIQIAYHNKDFADMMRQFKRVDEWNFPLYPEYPLEYLAGLIDTDGYVSKPDSKLAVNITQKAGDKLPKIRPILDAADFQHIKVVRRNSRKVGNEPYYVDVVWWRSREDVYRLGCILNLRYPRKKTRLESNRKHAHELMVNDKTRSIMAFLRNYGDATLPKICDALGLERTEALQALNHLRRFGGVKRNDPPVDDLLWSWNDNTEYYKKYNKEQR